jgi:glycosyltransferase involved in cell wall biosynthesis
MDHMDAAFSPLARPTTETMTETAADTVAPAAHAGLVEIVLPVYNEERQLEASCRELTAYASRLPIRWRVVIVDNGSTDRTWEIAARLGAELPGVRAHRLHARGRGRALRAAWMASDADVLCYMDIDLSTDMGCFFPLIAPLMSGHSELAIGSRLLPRSRVRRSLKREILSRVYNRLLRLVLRMRSSDAQCGFKAIRGDAARRLLPLVRDDGWFFDTELLAVAERHGLRIFEVPVDWREDPDSRVRIVRTVLQDLKGVARLRMAFWRRRDAAEVHR